MQKLFPEIGGACMEVCQKPLPKKADAYVAIVNPRYLGSNPNDSLVSLINKVLDHHKSSLGGWKRYVGDSRHMCQSDNALLGIDEIIEQQKGYNILIIPVQFNLYYTECSIMEIEETFQKNEFGLGLFEIICIFLTHSKMPKGCEIASSSQYSFHGDGDLYHRFVSLYDGERIGIAFSSIDDIRYRYYPTAFLTI